MFFTRMGSYYKGVTLNYKGLGQANGSFLKPFGQGKALLGVEMVHYRAIFHLFLC